METRNKIANEEIKSSYLKIDNHTVHYLNAGIGEPLLFVHGLPEWSMTYTEVIGRLAADFRCVAPDHLGFGYSEKDEKADLSSKGHSARLLKFIHALDLQNIHLVVHDFGGPIGIGALLQDPSRFQSLTISNSWLWNLEGTFAALGLKLLNGNLGKWLYLNKGFELKVMARNLFADRKDYDRWYGVLIETHKDPEDRYANFILMNEMLKAGLYYDLLAERLQKVTIPSQVLWGVKDKLFTKSTYFSKWKRMFPHFDYHEIPHSGHFPHMESPTEFADHIKIFIKKDLSTR